MKPKYPVYILSKGRWEGVLTADFLNKYDIDFRIAVEPQEASLYAAKYGQENLVVTPFSNLGQGPIPVRNFIRDHAQQAGHKFHWQMDDDLKRIVHYNKGKPEQWDAGKILSTIESFVDSYTNIGIAGVSSSVFAFAKNKPYAVNQMVYGCILFRNEMPYRWRCIGEDTDMSLQVLSGKYCTVSFNQFVFDTVTSGSNKGGNQDDYQNNLRLKRTRELMRRWPHLVKMGMKNGKNTFEMGRIWKYFDFPLIPK